MADQVSNFYILNSVAKWCDALLDNVVFSEDKDGLCLKRIPRVIKDGLGTFGGLSLPTGFAFDIFGNIYIVDTQAHTILRFNICKDTARPLECVGGKGLEPGEFNAPLGIAISPSGNLYVADSLNHRIQVFSVKGLVLRDIWGRTDEYGTPISGSGDSEFDSPADLAIDSQENVYVVDKSNNRIQKFTKHGNFLCAFGTAELSNPLYCTVDTRDQVYVIDDGSKVKKYSSAGTYLGDVTHVAEVHENFLPVAISVDAAGRIHYRLIYSLHHFFSHDVRVKLTKQSERGCSIVHEDVIPGIYFDNNKLVIQDENIPEPVDDEIHYVQQGTFYSQALDSKMYKCQWHKILLNAVIPLGTSIRVQTYTSEIKKDFLEIQGLSTSSWHTDQINAKDFLIQSPAGRFLWLKIILTGTVKESPVLKKIKIVFPRISYLQYLPRIYQEDPTSKAFLEQFLSIFEYFFEGIEKDITYIARIFNPLSTDKNFLPWLASWLGLSLDEKWPLGKRRELVRKAHQLYKMRGTVRGLQEILGLYIGKKFFSIIEHFTMRRRWLVLGDKCTLGCNSFLWEKGIALGENTEFGSFQLGNINTPLTDPYTHHAHKFSLIIPSVYCNTEEKERIIRRIVELWKPAHTQFIICKVAPRFRVGVQSTIGVDTVIARYPVSILGQVSSLGKDSILSESLEARAAPNFMLNRDVRLNDETKIN